jgi:hypothetical protein
LLLQCASLITTRHHPSIKSPEKNDALHPPASIKGDAEDGHKNVAVRLFFFSELEYLIAATDSSLNFNRHLLTSSSLGDSLVFDLHGFNLLAKIG